MFIKYFVSIEFRDTLKTIYYSYFHSIIKIRKNILGNNFNSWNIFILQKNIIRIMAVARLRTSGRSLKS